MKYFFLALLSALIFISCESISGNGNVRDEIRNVSNFRGVKTSGSIDVEIKSGDQYQVKVQDDENLLPYIITTVDDGVLNIRYKDGYSIMNNHSKVFVTAPNFEKVVSSGSADITSEGVILNSNQMEVSTSGSGDIKMEVDVPSVKAISSGSGDISLSGHTKDFECRISGSGDAKCGNLKSENAVVRVSGSSDVHVFASVSLKVNVTGSGDVYYGGNPSSPEIQITGSGTVKAVN